MDQLGPRRQVLDDAQAPVNAGLAGGRRAQQLLRRLGVCLQADQRRFRSLMFRLGRPPSPSPSPAASCRRRTRRACDRASCDRGPSRCAARVLLPPSAASTRSMYSRSSSASVSPRATAAPRTSGWCAALAHVRRQIVAADQRALGQRDRALDDVLQLAHVARPAIGEQRLARRLVETAHPACRPCAALRAPGSARPAARMSSGAIAQRRQVDLDDVEPVVEVLAEACRRASARSRSWLVAATHAHVDLLAARRAERADLALLQHAQELGLQRRRQLADLVEEERAAVGLDEHARRVGARVGEGAALVAEQLALEQRVGDGGAVERRRTAARAAGELKWIARATSSLPVPDSPVMSTEADEPERRRMSAEHLLHRRRAPDDVPER